MPCKFFYYKGLLRPKAWQNFNGCWVVFKSVGGDCRWRLFQLFRILLKYYFYLVLLMYCYHFLCFLDFESWHYGFSHRVFHNITQYYNLLFTIVTSAFTFAILFRVTKFQTMKHNLFFFKNPLRSWRLFFILHWLLFSLFYFQKAQCFGFPVDILLIF